MTFACDPTTPAWRVEAACRGMDTARWFPEGKGNIADAIAICSTCPVKAECLQYGLYYEPTGILGGATERERQVMRSQRGISLQKPEHASPRGPRRRR